MKFAEFRLEIRRTPEELWTFMFDLRNVPKWDPGVVEARQTSEGSLEKVGATIQTLGKGGIDRGTARVAEFEMYRRLVLALDREKGPIRLLTVAYSFEPIADGTVLIRRVEGDFVGIWRLLAPILAPRISKRVDKDSRHEAANIVALFPASS